MNTATRIILFLFGIWTLLFGIDFAFIRDLSGQFHYYGFIPISVAELLFSSLYLAGGSLMLAGSCLGNERVGRLGFLTASMGHLIFGYGILMQSVLIGTNSLDTGVFSTFMGSHSYIALSVAYFLAGTRTWSGR